jgi:hypothetical protein
MLSSVAPFTSAINDEAYRAFLLLAVTLARRRVAIYFQMFMVPGWRANGLLGERLHLLVSLGFFPLIASRSVRNSTRQSMHEAIPHPSGRAAALEAI